MKKMCLDKFRKSEDGSITAFLLIMFLIMIVSGGMAVDFMRHESERVLFQDVLDRAVLATASFDSDHATEAEIQEVIMSHFVAAGYDTDYLEDLKIYATVGDASRRVDVSANFEIRTFFLRILNKPTLTLAARSTAETKRSELELSLVVDVSGSMGNRPSGAAYSEPTKAVALKTAASNFIDALFNDPESSTITTVSLVPFSAQVAPSEELALQFAGLNNWHNYSYCFEFEENDFSTTAVEQYDSIEQGQNWRPWGQSKSFRWCPREANQILPFSNDPVKLKAAINGMQQEYMTSVWMGAKWGAALLDPSLQPVLAGLAGTTDPDDPSLTLVDPNFVGRPGSFDDSAVVKYLILMTDGTNTQHRFMTPAQFNHEDTNPWNSQENADYWEARAQTTDSRDAYNCDRNGRNCSYRNYTGSATSYKTLDNSSGTYRGFGDTRLENICNAAKNIDPASGNPLDASGRQRMIIYTIGFDVPEGGTVHEMMLACASDASKYYHADDATDLNNAFASIAASIQKLKLVVN